MRLYPYLSLLRGVFVGSGSEGMQQAEVAESILSMALKSKKVASDPLSVVYLGTATYDAPGPKAAQTKLLAAAGCRISEIALIKDKTLTDSNRQDMESADIILVSGGNTLYACDMWRHVGLMPLLFDAMKRGAVLTGGSAGAIFVFDAGHSDSADPTSYKDRFLKDSTEDSTEESTAAETATAAAAAAAAAAAPEPWQYIRVECAGMLPGLCCPHADKIQSNGVLRSTDFDAMLRRHPGERGVLIDHFAALVLPGDGSFSVLSLPGRPGSVLADGAFTADRTLGAPGIWVKDVDADTGEIACRLATAGAVTGLLRAASSIEQDSRCDLVRAANPL